MQTRVFLKQPHRASLITALESCGLGAKGQTLHDQSETTLQSSGHIRPHNTPVIEFSISLKGSVEKERCMATCTLVLDCVWTGYEQEALL